MSSEKENTLNNTDKRAIMDRLSVGIHKECEIRSMTPYEVGMLVSPSAAASATRWAMAETLPSIKTLAEVALRLRWDRDKVWFILTGEAS